MAIDNFISLLRKSFSKSLDSKPKDRRKELVAEYECIYSVRLAEHQARVYLMWLELEELLEDFFKDNREIAEEVKRRVLCHDISKLKPDEFPHYRQKRCPYPGEVIDERAFFRAQALHFERNDHHPEHWVEEDGTYFVPENKNQMICALFEMVCDWEATSIYSCKRSALHYFIKQRDDIALNPRFDDFIAELLMRFDTHLYHKGMLEGCRMLRPKEQLETDNCLNSKGDTSDV